MSQSSISISSSTMRKSKFIVGRQNDGAQTQSLSWFAPAWKTILQSSNPLGTAKYLISKLMQPQGGAIYFCSMNLMILFCSTSFSLGLSDGCLHLDIGPLTTYIMGTPLFCLDAIALGKTKENEPRATWIFKPVFLVACHRILHIALASSLASDSHLWILLDQ